MPAITTIRFVPPEPPQQPFELVDDGSQEGARPCGVAPWHTWGRYGVSAWQNAVWPWSYPPFSDPVSPSVLSRTRTGKKRLKLYCANALDADLRLTCSQGDSVRRIGRVAPEIEEAVGFAHTTEARLRYWYDAPSVRVDWSQLFDADGNPTQAPLYVQSAGKFVASQPVTGVVRVRYSPKATLLEVDYDTGQRLISSSHWRTMQEAWLTEGIDGDDIPNVWIMAFSPKGGLAADIRLTRHFSPSQAPLLSIERMTTLSGSVGTDEPVIFQEVGERIIASREVLDPETGEPAGTVTDTLEISLRNPTTGVTHKLRFNNPNG